MAQHEEGNTTAYLDSIDVPPIINSSPRPPKEKDESDNNTGKKISMTLQSVEPPNGLDGDKRDIVHAETISVVPGRKDD